MKWETTVVFKYTDDAYEDENVSVVVHQGGTRSGKTYNVLKWLIKKARADWKHKTIDIVRKSFPSLRASAMHDFFEILEMSGLYNEKLHNKTENIYKVGSNKFRFFSCDDGQKMRGPGRDILFCNEVNELKLDDYRQLNQRTSELTILDYNPSDEYHWVYKEVLPREDCSFHRTTYLDNFFLKKRIVKEIERYKEVDANYWRVYGLGERGVSGATIFTNWQLTDEPKPAGYNCKGLDFGYNDPNALIDIVIVDHVDGPYLWLDELHYESGQTTPKLSESMKAAGVTDTDTIYGDNSRPETIQELSDDDFNIHPCTKGPGSVKAGIDWIKRYPVHITKRSLNLQREIQAYKWKVNKEDKLIDEPVDLNNHAIDAVRYGLNEKIQNEKEEEFWTH